MSRMKIQKMRRKEKKLKVLKTKSAAWKQKFVATINKLMAKVDNW